MLRIHFTDRDLARVHLAYDPLWETVLATHQLGRTGASAYSSWRRHAQQVIIEEKLTDCVRAIRLLAPARAGYFPDFLTPAAARDGMPAGLDALCRTPRQQMENEVAWAFNGRQAPAWIHALAEGDQKARTQLAAALDRVHQALVVPNWTRAAAVVEADLALRARALRDGAVHGLLNSLRPILDWAPPVLAAPYPEDRELHLDGRGLCLIPSRFCWAMPVALADPSLPQVLVYPVASAHAAAQPHEGSHPRALATLLGRSRARVLAALDGTTTSELARILALSASSASEHVTALREAGLACSNRIDNRVLHTRSPLGTALLQAQQPTSDDHAQPDGFLQQPRR